MKQEITKFIGKIQLGAKRNAPELLLGGALITGTATVVLSSRATLKAKEIKDRFSEDKMALEFKIEHKEMDEEQMKSEVKKLYIGYALKLTKEYAIPVTLYAATVAMIFGSYKIQKNRQVALSAALASCTAAYTTLMNKVKKGAAMGLTAKEVLEGVEGREVVDPETGEVSIEKYQGEVVKDLYQYRFDKYSTAWEKDKFQNEATLRAVENWSNDMLRLRGYIFLNEILDRLSLPMSPEGQLVGWLFNDDGSGYVDFGIRDCEERNDSGFDYNAFDLTFNVQGNILTKFKDVELF